jgi:hypothetical protein
MRTSSPRQPNAQVALVKQLVRTTRIVGLGGPGSPCGPGGRAGPTGPCMPGEPVSPLGPSGPCEPASPFFASLQPHRMIRSANATRGTDMWLTSISQEAPRSPYLFSLLRKDTSLLILLHLMLLSNLAYASQGIWDGEIEDLLFPLGPPGLFITGSSLDWGLGIILKYRCPQWARGVLTNLAPAGSPLAGAFHCEGQRWRARRLIWKSRMFSLGCLCRSLPIISTQHISLKQHDTEQHQIDHQRNHKRVHHGINSPLLRQFFLSVRDSTLQFD